MLSIRREPDCVSVTCFITPSYGQPRADFGGFISFLRGGGSGGGGGGGVRGGGGGGGILDQSSGTV